MKKNNFFIGALLGAVVLSGVSFEARGMDAGSVIFTGAGLLAAGLLLKNSEPVQTYGKHRDRLAQEKEVFDNPLVHAEPFPSSGVVQGVTSVEERIAAYEAQQKRDHEAFLFRKMEEEKPCVTTNKSWEDALVIDSYEANNK